MTPAYNHPATDTQRAPGYLRNTVSHDGTLAVLVFGGCLRRGAPRRPPAPRRVLLLPLLLLLLVVGGRVGPPTVLPASALDTTTWTWGVQSSGVSCQRCCGTQHPSRTEVGKQGTDYGINLPGSENMTCVLL